MLEAIRARSTSFVVKLLFVLLIISFGAWGIGDVVRGGAGQTYVASVGKVDITPNAFNDAFLREMRRLQGMFGTQLDREQARALGVTNAVLGRMVNDALLSQEAEDLGLIVSDDIIRRRIHENPDFFNTQRKFDPAMFEQVIRSNGYDENAYVNLLRREIRRSQIVESLGEPTSPAPLVDALFRHRMEERTAKSFVVRDNAMTDVPAPDAETLKKYHADHAELFSAPEYRAVTFVTLDAAQLAKEITITDESVRTAFDQRQGEFRIPERRKLQHLVVNAEDKAQAALKRLRDGEDFPAVAKDVAGMEPDALDIGELAREQLLPEMAEAAFTAPQGGYTDPVKSPLGWHVIKVAAISPAREESFAEVKDALRAELAHEKAVDSLFAMANKFEDGLGSGATIEEAAGRLNLDVRKVAGVDRQGRGADGKPIDDLPKANNFLSAVFEVSEGADTSLTEAGTDAYFIARVDKVTPPVVKPLEAVQEDVSRAWYAEQRRDRAKEKAEALLKQITDGASIEDVAATLKAEVATSEPFRRGDRRAPLPQDLVKSLFAAKVGGAALARTAEGYQIAVLAAVKAADPKADPEALESVKDTLSDGLRGDILNAYASALRDSYPVKVNAKALENF